ncbi:AF4/FMR2 family member 4 isoform X1 [Cyprinodon tularosa]|uniref:AF4/FMR2 family member 4 isoform X1 n=1 Tax=Cyprinodon tularosa TaxID=77115 RepID=UPI0018E2509A|nr:AF4/FMR2 family member 4 isoform X1 [Cyprinodon tularosa]
MASQPSEERNLLRRRAWEQRIQETSLSKELDAENVPLFAEPYKTNRGDELSDRIQRMLGSYEDVNNTAPFSLKALPIPSYATFSQSDQNRPSADLSNGTLFHDRDVSMSTQSLNGTSNSGFSSPPSGSSLNQYEHSSRLSVTSLSHGQFSHSGHHRKEREVFGLPQEISALSPDAKPLPVLHSSDHNMDMDTRDTFNRPQLQGSPDISSGETSVKLSPVNPPPQQAKTNTLPCQTFSSLLSSKQAGIVMTQKPTAYVRPMDGQDQVVNKSPELKPSPEHYESLPELIDKTDIAKTKTIPQFLEATSDEDLCVEDILREMTKSCPPLLTAIHTPKPEPSQSPVLAKEAEQVSSCPEEKNTEFSIKDQSHYSQENSSKSLTATHSSDAETTSSSDSESSVESESDSDVSVKEPPKPLDSKLVKIEPDSVAVSHCDWQLGEWLRSRQQNSNTDAQTSKQTCADTSEGSKSLSQQKELTADVAVPQRSSESSRAGSFSQDNSKTCLPDGASYCSSSRKLSKASATSCTDRPETAICVKTEEHVTTENTKPRLTDNPKAKSKTGHHKKDRKDTKEEAKRTKHTKHHNLSPAPPIKISCSKTHTETKVPHKSTHKHLNNASKAASSSLDHYRPPKSLLVKFDLSLLSRVPGNNKEVPRKEKRAAKEMEKEEASKESSKASTPGKVNKKSQNVKVEIKGPPKKKPKLEKKQTLINPASVKVEGSNKPGKEQKKVKKTSQEPVSSKDTTKASKVQNRSAKILVESKETVKSKESRKHKEIKGKLHKKGKTPEGRLAVPSTSQPQKEAASNRSLLKIDKRQYPVNHYIKEAKKLKHKADADPDKLSKAFTYLEAAMFFVESGIALEKDPQISGSSYTMFAETVELLKFVLKLKNPVDSSAAPSEKDFVALCLKCQSLLQMAMFRHKQKIAIKFSKTLTDHFSNFAQGPKKHLSSSKTAENPSPSVPSPASSGPSSNHSGSSIAVDGATVAIPQNIEQMAFSYVNITSLFVSAHDLWEQAEELAQKGSGISTELDAALGPLKLISSMSFMVRYIRQGINWLRLDSQKL